jgi:hypothetical protein
MSACSSDLEWLSLFTLLVNVNQLSWLYSERWAVNTLPINKNVAVNNELTGLSDCASKASTKNNRIKTHFKKFYKVLTGQAWCAF